MKKNDEKQIADSLEIVDNEKKQIKKREQK